MQERIIDLIVYLLGKLRERNRISKLEVSRLAEFGYTQTEISTALSWIYDKMNAKQPLKRMTKSEVQSYRIFHQVEKHILTKEARGFLIEMFELGLIDKFDLENIIERAMMTGSSSVGLGDIKSIAAAVLFNFNAPGNYGSRLMLDSSDTIN
ncbi:MAG: DUF494 family protein [Candidatus Kryptoniota bacterium]